MPARAHGWVGLTQEHAVLALGLALCETRTYPRLPSLVAAFWGAWL
jgi:hypothetical protein